MRILITNNTLAGRSGTTLYVRDLAAGLLARGDTPLIYTPELGEIASELTRAGVEVVADPRALSTPPDVIHGHHEIPTMEALLRFRGVPGLFVCHDPWHHSDIPPLFPRIRRYVAVDHYCRERLVNGGIAEQWIRVIPNGVDLRRFLPRSPLPERPRRALVFSNYASERKHLPVMRQACARAGLCLDVVGAAAGTSAARPETMLGQYDLVLATGRCAIEAAAVGTAVILYDALGVGVGPLVTSGNLDALRRLDSRTNHRWQKPLSADALLDELARYDARDAAEVSRLVRQWADLDSVVRQLVAIYQEVLIEHAATGGRETEEAAAAAAYRRSSRGRRLRSRIKRVPNLGPLLLAIKRKIAPYRPELRPRRVMRPRDGLARLRRWAAAALRPPVRAVMRVPLARRALLVALGVPFDPFGRAFHENPYPFYERLRRRDPVYLARIGCWLVTGYAQATAVLRDPRFGHPHHGAASLTKPGMTPLDCLWSRFFIVKNPPDHTRVRRAVAEHLAPREAEALRPRIHALTERLLDRVEPAGRMDVIEDLAYPLAVGTFAEVLGVPGEDVDRLRPRVHSLAAIVFDFLPSRSRLERVDAAVEWLRDYFGRLIVERRQVPRADLLTALVQAERQGQLDAEEVLATSILLMTAGYETTVAVIGNGVCALLRHPTELRRLRDDGELIRGAVEECIRYEAPIQSFGRTALEDVVLGHRRIRRGQQVYVVTGAANRDPDRFPDPDRLDITRPDNRHLGFGAGIHACPGQYLARIEAQVAIGALVRRFGRMDLLTPRPRWHGSVHQRGLEALPIALSR